MNRVGVRELRQNLSVYLRRVRAGESLEVTERGVPVASLQPLERPDDPLAELERRGLLVRRATGRIADLPDPPEVPLERSLSTTVSELREDRI